MTVASLGDHEGILKRVDSEKENGGDAIVTTLSELKGVIQSDLSIGANVAGCSMLKANEGLSCRGVSLHGAGFIITPQEAKSLGFGEQKGLDSHIRSYRNGRDLTGSPRGVLVIDLFGLTERELQNRFPSVYQWVYDRVKPERDHNNRQTYRDNWWIFGEARSAFRPALAGLNRFIATVETAKHRVFQFLDGRTLPDNKLVNVAVSDAFFLGIVSSRLHSTWALSTGALLEDRPVYVKSECFEKFPFPDPTEIQREAIREYAERLDSHRKQQQTLHPTLTITDMYNVLEKLRSGEPLTDKEKKIHEQGLVSVLKQIHNDLDAAVFEAYGWPVTLTDEEILERLVALNAERAEEEKRGLIRWLRPEFQNPTGESSVEKKLAISDDEDDETPATGKGKGKKPKGKSTTAKKLPWPKKLSEQVQSIAQQLNATSKPITSEELAQRFTRPNLDQLEEVLETLVTLGKARETKSGKFTAV